MSGSNSSHTSPANGSFLRFPSRKRSFRFRPMSLKKSVGGRGRRAAGAPPVGAAGQAGTGCMGSGISLASLRRFWAAAARWNSSRAPFGPRNRSRSSWRMRLRCANIWPGRASPRRPYPVFFAAVLADRRIETNSAFWRSTVLRRRGTAPRPRRAAAEKGTCTDGRHLCPTWAQSRLA